MAWEQSNSYDGSFKAGTGYTEEDAAQFCHLFDDVVDILEIREHDGCASHLYDPPMSECDLVTVYQNKRSFPHNNPDLDTRSGLLLFG